MSYNNNQSTNQIYHYIEIGRYQQALEKLSDLLADNPNDAELLYLRAYSLYKMDQVEEAKACCKAALSYGFSQEEGNYLLGKIYMDAEQYKQSERCLLEAVSVNPQSAKTIATYGYLMLITGNEQKAEQLFKEALRIDPNNNVVLHYRFYYYLAKGKHKEQIHTLSALLKSSNNELSNLVKIGLAELFKDNYKAARENFRQAFLLDPTNESILSILEEVDRRSHPIFLPHRLMDKVGGGAVIWITVMILVVVFSFLELQAVTGVIAGSYVVFALYTWVAKFFYKWFLKVKN